MGSQLFFRLACTVPLAVTRLERNVFPGLFLASLISNYESETTRWAVASSGRIALPLHPFLFSTVLSRVFSILIQRLASSNLLSLTLFFPPFTPFLLSGPWCCPGRILRFATFVRSYLQFAISRPTPSFTPPLSLSPSPLHFCEREMRYVFIVDIYISSLRAKMREL